MREHHRAHGGGDQQRAGGLEGEDVPREQDGGERLQVATVVGVVEALDGAEADLAEAEDQDQAERETGQRRHQSLTLDRLDDRVGGVDAHQHQDEEEQHQDRAHVDDDLYRKEERGLERGVHDGQADHHDREQECRMNIARGDRRGAAPAPQEGVGEHAARDPALQQTS